MGGFSSSKSSSTPVDMTPTAFKNLQMPFAMRLGQLMGINPNVVANGWQSLMQPQGPTGPMGPTGGPTGVQQQTDKLRFIPLGGSFGRASDTDMTHLSVFYVPTDKKDNAGNTLYRNSNGGSMLFRMQGTPEQQNVGPVKPFDWKSIFTGDPNDPLTGIPTYKGPLTADLTGNENSILKQLMARQTGNKTGYNMTTSEKYLNGVLNQSLAAYADELAAASNTGAFSLDSPFLQKMIETAQRPTREALTETLTRDLPGRFTQAGQFIQPQGSSAFDRAAAIATRGAANALGDIATRITYDSGEAARQREGTALIDRSNQKMDAAKTLPTINAQEVDNMIKNLQAQALPRLIKQAGIDKGIELFNKRVDDLLKSLGIAAGITQPTIANEQKSKSSSFNKASPF